MYHARVPVSLESWAAYSKSAVETGRLPGEQFLSTIEGWWCLMRSRAFHSKLSSLCLVSAAVERHNLLRSVASAHGLGLVFSGLATHGNHVWINSPTGCRPSSLSSAIMRISPD